LKSTDLNRIQVTVRSLPVTYKLTAHNWAEAHNVLTANVNYACAGIFSHSVKLRGLLEYVYAGLWDKVSISKAAWSNYRPAGHMWSASFVSIDLMLYICCSREF